MHFSQKSFVLQMQCLLYFRCTFSANLLIFHFSPTRNPRAYLTLQIFNPTQKTCSVENYETSVSL